MQNIHISEYYIVALLCLHWPLSWPLFWFKLALHPTSPRHGAHVKRTQVFVRKPVGSGGVTLGEKED